MRARAEAETERAAEVERMCGWVEEARERLRALEGVFFLGGDSEEAEGGVGVWARDARLGRVSGATVGGGKLDNYGS